LVYFINAFFSVAEAKNSKKKKQHKHSSASTRIDHSYIAGTYLQHMIASLGLHYSQFVSRGVTKFTDGEEHKMKVLLIGLGGGALAMFISKYIPNVS